ncbi:hypothetical protein HK097_002372, partial [Rhizophlyctis rosea]
MTDFESNKLPTSPISPLTPPNTPTTPPPAYPPATETFQIASPIKKRDTFWRDVAIHTVQLAAALLFVVGLTSQGMYGPRNICLLYVRDYHTEPDSLVFSARSVACPNAIGIGTTGIVLSVTFLLLSLFSRHLIFPHPPTKPFLLTLTIISLLFSIIALTMAAFATAGLKQTCREFESLNGVPCGEVFENGFFEE